MDDGLGKVFEMNNYCGYVRNIPIHKKWSLKYLGIKGDEVCKVTFKYFRKNTYICIRVNV